MIRRNPTLILMSDIDVQDIRNMVEAQQQQQMEGDNNQKLQAEEWLSEDLDEVKNPTKINRNRQQEHARRLGLVIGT